MSTEHQRRVMEELAERVYAELLRPGTPEPEARGEVANALEMWGRLFEPDPH
jgi:hypothetical protein